MKVWGRPSSICTQRVLWACAEMGIDVELILASATMGPVGHISTGATPFGIVDTPSYRAMNPNGTVPTIDDNGAVLWESNAIVSYLAMKHGASEWWNDEPQRLAQRLAWMSWVNEHLEPALHTLVMECVRLPPARRDPDKKEQARQQGEEALKCVDGVLGQQRFMSGDGFGIADIPLGCAAYRWSLFELEASPLPALDAWLERVASRPGFQTHVMPRQYHLG